MYQRIATLHSEHQRLLDSRLIDGSILSFAHYTRSAAIDFLQLPSNLARLRSRPAADAGCLRSHSDSLSANGYIPAHIYLASSANDLDIGKCDSLTCPQAPTRAQPHANRVRPTTARRLHSCAGQRLGVESTYACYVGPRTDAVGWPQRPVAERNARIIPSRSGGQFWYARWRRRC